MFFNGQDTNSTSCKFSEPGRYLISLEVTDDQGQSSVPTSGSSLYVRSVQINGVTSIHDNWPLWWGFVTFGASSIPTQSAGSLVSWSGGGNPATQQGGDDFTTEWTQTGTYTVTLSGCGGNFTKDVTVFDLDLDVQDVLEEDEWTPGKYILVNNDDDNENEIPDKDDSGQVIGEDDLVEITLSIEPELESGMVWLNADWWDDGDCPIKIWETEEKGIEVIMEEYGTSARKIWELSEETLPAKLYVEAQREEDVALTFVYDYFFDWDRVYFDVFDYTVKVESVTFGGSKKHTLYKKDSNPWNPGDENYESSYETAVPNKAWVRDPALADPICYTKASTGNQLTTTVDISISPPLKKSSKVTIKGFYNPEFTLFTSCAALDQDSDSATFGPMDFEGALPDSVGGSYFVVYWTVRIDGGVERPIGTSNNALFRILGPPCVYFDGENVPTAKRMDWTAGACNNCTTIEQIGNAIAQGIAGGTIFGDDNPVNHIWKALDKTATITCGCASLLAAKAALLLGIPESDSDYQGSFASSDVVENNPNYNSDVTYPEFIGPGEKLYYTNTGSPDNRDGWWDGEGSFKLKDGSVWKYWTVFPLMPDDAPFIGTGDDDEEKDKSACYQILDKIRDHAGASFYQKWNKTGAKIPLP